MPHNFWYLFIWVIVGTGLLFLIEWASTSKRPTSYVAYGLSAFIGSIAAYFIDEKIGQAIIVLALSLVAVWVIKVLTKISGK